MFSDNLEEDLEIVTEIHDEIIEASGGASGFHDEKLVRSAIARPLHTVMGKSAYPGVHKKAAALLDSVANNHGFRDGNKRTAMAVAGYYLDTKDYDLQITNQEYEDFMLHVVGDKPSVNEISKWLKDHCVHIPATKWSLYDAQALNKEHPDTFHTPTAGDIESLHAGSAVKLIFNVDEPDPELPSGERMWVIIDKITENGFEGTLDNDPAFIRGLKYKDRVSFQARHIASIYDD